MWAFRRCIPDHFHIIAPQAFLDDPIGGHSWWQVADTSTGKADALAAAAKLKVFMIEALSNYGILPKCCLALGFSQGAGLLSVLIQQDSSFFAGVGLLAGFVIEGEVKSVPHQTSVFMAHGVRDSTVSLAKAKAGADFLRGFGFKVEFHEDDVEHKVGATGMRKLKEWVGRF